MPPRLTPQRELDFLSAGISGGDDSNVFDLFMQQPRQTKVSSLAGRNVTTWNGDEAYENQAHVIPQTIMDLVFTANQTFFTDYVMPWRVTNNIHLEWERLEANAHIMPENAYQAPAPLIAQKKTMFTASLTRRGIAFRVEHDWIDTVQGRRSVAVGYGQIARSYQETANLEVIRALLHAAHWNQAYVRQTGRVTRLDLLDYLRHSRDYFAYFQKQKNGPALWDNRTDADAQVYNGKFNTIILPEVMYSYITMVRPEVTDYYMRGPAGPAAIDGAGGGVSIPPNKLADSKEPKRWLNSKRVYPCRAFQGDGHAPLDLLAKRTEIGEYNRMTDEYCNYHNGYISRERDILIFDENRDRFSVFGLATACKNSNIWDEDGNLRLPIPPDAPSNALESHDARRDFLVMQMGNTRETVKYIGDIGVLFQDTAMFMNAAETLKHLLAPNDREKGDMAAAYKKGDATWTVYETRLKNILGKDNIFVENAGNQTLKYRVTAGGRAAGEAYKSDLIQNQAVDDFIDMMQQLLPTEDIANRAAVQDLVLGATSKEQIVNDVGNFLIERVVGAGKEFPSEDAFSSYYVKRSSIKVKNSNDIRFKRVSREFPKGSQLPEGYQWVNAADAVPNVASGLLASCLEDCDLPHLRQQPIENDYVDDVPVRTTGQGFHSHVGTVYGFGENDEGLAMQDDIYKNRPISNVITRSMFNEHMSNIVSINGEDSLEAFLAILYLGCTVKLKTMLRFISSNILFPFNFLLLRPHASYRGRTIIKAFAGEVGKTWYCPGQTEMGHDVNTMTSIVHSVAHIGAVVDKPEFAYAQENMYIDRYYGGLGMKCFNPESYRNRTAEGNDASVIVCAVPHVEREFPNPLDIAGRFYTDYQSPLINVALNEEGHYSTFYRYNNLFQFYSETAARDELVYPTVLPDDYHCNRVCWQGAQYGFNRISGKFDYVEENTSPWGELVYSG